MTQIVYSLPTDGANRICCYINDARVLNIARVTCSRKWYFRSGYASKLSRSKSTLNYGQISSLAETYAPNENITGQDFWTSVYWSIKNFEIRD